MIFHTRQNSSLDIDFAFQGSTCFGGGDIQYFTLTLDVVGTFELFVVIGSWSFLYFIPICALEEPYKNPFRIRINNRAKFSNLNSMAEDSTTNFFRYSFGRTNFTNVNFINMRFHSSQLYQYHSTSPSRHSILTFAAAVLINFLELKYQGKDESPFETHPKTMFLTVTSLLLYCLSYDAKLRFRSNDSYACIFKSSMALFGPLSLASVLSVLFPELLSPVLFSLSVLLSLFEMPCSHFTRFWKWMQQVIWVEIRSDQQYQGRRRRLVGLIHQPRLLENVSVEEEDELPV